MLYYVWSLLKIFGVNIHQTIGTQYCKLCDERYGLRNFDEMTQVKSKNKLSDAFVAKEYYFRVDNSDGKEIY